MATSTIPAKTAKAVLYSNSTYRNDIGKTLTLSDSIENYSLLRVTVYGATNTAATHRTLISIASLRDATLNGHFPIACNAVLGSVRLSLSGNQLAVTSSSYNAVFISNVTGVL